MTSQANPLLSVEQVAAILKLHVRTVRNYVRGGTLRATRIGKQYRIALADLEKLTGKPLEAAGEPVPGAANRVEVSSVVNIEGITAALAGRLTDLLNATAATLRSGEQQVAVTTAYDEPMRRIRVVLAADLKTTRDFLQMIEAALKPG